MFGKSWCKYFFKLSCLKQKLFPCNLNGPAYPSLWSIFWKSVCSNTSDHPRPRVQPHRPPRIQCHRRCRDQRSGFDVHPEKPGGENLADSETHRPPGTEITILFVVPKLCKANVNRQLRKDFDQLLQDEMSLIELSLGEQSLVELYFDDVTAWTVTRRKVLVMRAPLQVSNVLFCFCIECQS